MKRCIRSAQGEREEMSLDFTLSMATRHVARMLAPKIKRPRREFVGNSADGNEPIRIAEIEFSEINENESHDDYVERMFPKIGILAILLMNSKRIYRLDPISPHSIVSMFDDVAVRGSLGSEPKSFRFEVAFAP